jgi:tRNA(Ile)-lysidine synthase
MRSTAESRPLELEVARALEAAGVGEGAGIVVGVSGGPDSTALLAALASIAGRARFQLRACIVDHGIRSPEEIEGDIEFVHGLSNSLGVPLSVRRIPRGECVRRARRERRSIEEIARENRLRLLEELTDEVGAEVVALGHTRDDAVETILMRILQGAGPAGLAGIAPRRGVFVRPLLSLSRSEILAFLSKKKLRFRIDSMNNDASFLRNRLRLQVIPVLSQAVPGFGSGLLSMARQFSYFNKFLHNETSKRLPWKKTKSGFRLSAEAFFAAPPSLRAYSLLSLFDRLRPGNAPRRLPFRFLEPVLDKPLDKEGVLLRGHGVKLRKSNGMLAWGRDIVTKDEKSYFITIEADGSYSISGAVVSVDFTGGTQAGTGVSEVGIRMGSSVPPLVLRSERKGDGLILEYGRKSIQELFREWKVPKAERKIVPLLVDRSGVLAVLGGAFGYATRVRAGVSDAAGEMVIRIRPSRNSRRLKSTERGRGPMMYDGR